MTEHHEGQALIEQLKKAGCSQSDLARAVGVSTAAIHRWKKRAHIHKQAWEKLPAALRKLGIDPHAVSAQSTAPRDDLDRLLEAVSKFSLEDVAVVEDILEQPEATQRLVRCFVRGLLASARREPPEGSS